jgi:hypothetical protein
MPSARARIITPETHVRYLVIQASDPEKPTALATVNDAFGAASRPLTRSLTSAAMLCVRLVGAEKRPLLAEQRNAGETRLISGPNLVPNVRNEVCSWLPTVATRRHEQVSYRSVG